MNVYKIELFVIDLDNIGEESIKSILERNRYCYADVKALECRDIGAWCDEHPLNNKQTSDAEYRRIFAD